MKHKEKGEALGRHRGIKAGGGQVLNRAPEDGELVGVDETGKPLTGTHGGPHDDGGARRGESNRRKDESDDDDERERERGGRGEG